LAPPCGDSKRCSRFASIRRRAYRRRARPRPTDTDTDADRAQSIAKETATADIAVNCITPAAARTRIFDQMSEEHIGYMLAKIPRGRFLQVSHT
jgi:hypothetical protein